MKIPLEFQLTSKIVDLISKIETKKALLENISIHPQLISNLRRQSLLKSSLFSAKIEGNKLNVFDFENLKELDPKLKDRIEVENILSAFAYLDKNIKSEINLNFILNLHKIVMKRLSIDLGTFRKEPSAIFNESGFVVYVPPTPSQINDLIKKLIEYINLKNNDNPLIIASLSHISFEKIHPFLDGNGRIGRLLFQAILLKNGYDFNHLFSLEEILNERKEEYYAYLDKNDATPFIEFILEILFMQLQKTLENFQEKKITDEDLLLPRRKEILEIVRDHEVVSLDLVKRRFYNIPDRTLRYDLKQLEKAGYIIKLGSTRGALYSPKK